MGHLGRTFAYRGFTSSTGKTLARIVHKRCKHKAAEYVKKHSDVKAHVTNIKWQGLDGSWMSFDIDGRTLADERAYLDATAQSYRHSFRSGADLEERVEQHLAREKKRMAKSGSLSVYAQPRRYGWRAAVRIDIRDHGENVFEVEVQKDGDVPKEILRCLESSYNEIRDKFG